MEVRKDMPEEVKNRMVNGKKRVVTERIPEKLVKKITEKLALKRKRLQIFVKLAFQIAQAQKKQQETLGLLTSVEDSISDILNRAYKKMRLANRKEYTWRFDGKENFIGVYNPPRPKKKEEPKKK